MKYKLYCDANYYSPDCSVKCVANETCTCDPATGRCRPGMLSATFMTNFCFYWQDAAKRQTAGIKFTHRPKTRSSADADNGLDAFVGQSRSKNIWNAFQVKYKKNNSE